MRYSIDISFDGTEYAGWQRQPNAMTVQQRIEEALATYFRTQVPITGAGRTDAGVHATQLTAHFDWEEPLPDSFLHSINGLLPYDIAVRNLNIPSDPEFHARFSATERAYTYQIVRRKSPLHRKYAMWVRQPLDVNLMQQAADMLKEYKEFGSFCKAHADNHTNFCRIDRAEFEQKEDLLLFHIQADRFLRGMVRAIVGSLIWVGVGRWSLEDFRQAIEAQDRSAAGPAADAKGLFLVKVAYQDQPASGDKLPSPRDSG